MRKLPAVALLLLPTIALFFSLEALAATHPSPEAVYLNQGNKLFNHYRATDDQKSLELAIEEFSKAIALNPDFADAYNNRGTAYYLLGEQDKARRDFRTALSIDPKNVPAKKNLEMLKWKKLTSRRAWRQREIPLSP